MWIDILGPVEARRPDGSQIALGGPQLRGLFALLALDAGKVVSAERLIDGLHGDNPPEGAGEALQSQVSRLRRRLRDGGAPDGLVEFSPAGYRLAVDPQDVDLHRFERLAEAGRTAAEPARALELLTEALGLWRGPALGGLADLPPAARLEELRLAATEDRIEAGLALGKHDRLVAELRELTQAHPLRERLSAQLMRALQGSGRQAEALAVFDGTRRLLADELGADPSAELAGTHLSVLRSAAIAARPVPAQLTGFVGREDELARLGDLLGASRLVTLTGPGGAGKTRMSIEAAGRDAGEVCFVELAPVSGDVPQAVLAALGLREQGVLAGSEAADPQARLVTGLADRPLLLVLDNCEHVVAETAGLVRRLLSECPGLRVLATGREALGLTGEVLFPVGPLAPGVAEQLFVDRAAAVSAGADLDPGTVTRVCQALDGLPLAIELAAARLRTMSLDEAAARLGDRFRLLSRGDRTAEPRHRTLRAVVEWSWDLLDENEQVLARRFTMFAGGARLGAIERVCGLADVDELLAGLVEKSLVDVSDGRYRMLETVRAFCAERFLEADEEALRAKHSEYFLDLALAAEPQLRGSEQLTWLARLTAEHADLHAALRWAVREDPELAVRLVAELSWYWWLRGLRGEAVPFADAVVATFGATPPHGFAEEYVLCVVQASDTELAVGPLLAALDQPLRHPYLFLVWALSGRRPNDVDGAALARLVGPDPWSQAFHRIGDGLQALYSGQVAVAEERLSESLQGFRVLGDRWGAASALEKLAEFADWRGDRPRFFELMDEAVRLVGELGAVEDAADLLCRRADGLLRGGDAEAARADYERAAESARSSGTPVNMARARGGLGEIARHAGDLAEARRWYELALAGCDARSVTGGETRTKLLTGLGRTAVAEGDQDAATTCYQDALAVALEYANLPGAASAVEGLAGVLAARDDGERAALLLGTAVALRGSPIAGDPDVAATERRARGLVGSEAYDNAFGRGLEMPRDQVLAEFGQRRSALGS